MSVVVNRLEHKWELLDEWTARCKVYGGWLVTNRNLKMHSMCFVSDCYHQWQVTNPFVMSERK